MQKTTSKKTTAKGTKKPSSSKVSSEKKAEKKTVKKTKGEKLKLEKIPKMPPKPKSEGKVSSSSKKIEELKKKLNEYSKEIETFDNENANLRESNESLNKSTAKLYFELGTTEIANRHLRTEIDHLEANIQELQKRAALWERAAERNMLENKDLRSKIEEFKNLNWFQRLFWKKD